MPYDDPSTRLDALTSLGQIVWDWRDETKSEDKRVAEKWH